MTTALVSRNYFKDFNLFFTICNLRIMLIIFIYFSFKYSSIFFFWKIKKSGNNIIFIKMTNFIFNKLNNKDVHLGEKENYVIHSEYIISVIHSEINNFCGFLKAFFKTLLNKILKVSYTFRNNFLICERILSNIFKKSSQFCFFTKESFFYRLDITKIMIFFTKWIF